jgi:squalene-associated FAD-dependent desaturase
MPEKFGIVKALRRLVDEPAQRDGPFCEWLELQGQTQRMIDRFWSVVLVSALNESIDRVGLKYARKVFRDAFWSDRRGFEVSVPRAPLDRLYGEELRAWFEKHGVAIRFNEAAAAFEFRGRTIGSVVLRSGERLAADAYVAAIPPERLLALMPAEIAAEPIFANLRNFEYSPITSVHLWFDRPITNLPHVVFVDCLSQWLFHRGGGYVQIVVSAAQQLRRLRGEEIRRLILEEIAQLFPNLMDAKLVRAKVVTEQAATFSPVPGVDAWRPGPTTPIERLFLAGDWTATGWPATMESAVISGNRAAEAIREREESDGGRETQASP